MRFSFCLVLCLERLRTCSLVSASQKMHVPVCILVTSQIDRVLSHKQHSFHLTVPALRGVSYEGSQSIRGFCHLNLCCFVSAGKAPF